MSDLFAFCDPANDATIRLDISDYIGGLEGDENPDFGEIPKSFAASESFLLPGAYFGSTHAGMRTIRLPIAIRGASADAALSTWRSIIKEVNRQSSLKVLLHGTSTPVWFDLGPSQSVTKHSTLYQRWNWVLGEVLLQVYPYARGAEQSASATVDNEANNTMVIASVLGDVSAPAKVEFTLDAVANRFIGRTYLRTGPGDPDDFDSIFDESNYFSLANGGSIESGAVNWVPPAVGDWYRFATWRENTNEISKTGSFHLWAAVKDTRSVAGDLKLRLNLAFEDSAGGFEGPEVRISRVHASSYEMWYLGTFNVPDTPEAPTVWYWRLHGNRTDGSTFDEVDIDYLLKAPVDESVGIIDFDSQSDLTGDAMTKYSFDSETRRAWWGGLNTFKAPATLLGAGLWLRPGVQNNVIIHASADTHTDLTEETPRIEQSLIDSLMVKYRPRYEFMG